MVDILFVSDFPEEQKHVLSELSAISTRIKIKQYTVREFLSATHIKAKAVFFPMLRSQINTGQFSSVVDKVLQRFNKRGGLYFRFYMYPLDFSPSMFTAMIDDENHDALDRLADVVHIAPCSLEELKRHIQTFLKTRGEVRRYHAFRSVEASLKVLVGIVAKVATAASFLFIFAWLTSIYNDAVARAIGLADIGYAANIAAGIAIAPALLYLQFRIRSRKLDHNDEGARSNEYNSDVLYKMIIFAAAMAGVYLYIHDRTGFLTIAVTLIFGGVVNALTRQYYNGIRVLKLQAMNAEEYTELGKKLPKVLSHSPGRVIHRFRRVPIFSSGKHFPRVFCSYTHSSVWARQMVQKVHTELSSYGFECFVDQYGIAPGSSWRHQLRQSLVNADYVLCFCDGISIQKPWPASELEVAIRLRHTSSNLNIIAITPQDMDDDIIPNILPVFRDVFLNEGEPSRFIKVARESGDFMGVMSRHSIIIQEDFLDKSISADTPLLLIVPFFFWKLSAAVTAMFRFLLVPAIMTVAFVIAAQALISDGSFLQAAHALTDALTFGITGTPQLILYGILLMCFCSSVLEIVHRHIVTKPAKALSAAKKMSERFFSAVQLIYIVAFLAFVPFFTVVNAENWAIFVTVGFYACCGIALRYANRLDVGKVARCDNFLSGYNVVNNPIQTPQPWAFMSEQRFVLADRPHILKTFHSYINNFKGSYNPVIFRDSVVKGLRLYGTGVYNRPLLDAYAELHKISESLNKCGFSYNMMAVYDDMAEIAAFLGKYEEAITAFMHKCECLYASFYSTYKDYSEIYETQYRIAWLYKMLNKRNAAYNYASLALRGLRKNVQLRYDYLTNHIYIGHSPTKRTSPLLVIWRTIRNRSLTIGFKFMTNKNERLIDEIERFRLEL